MSRNKKPDTRQNILNSARKLFSQKGYYETAISDIIQDVGMSQGSFYNYFKSKRDIFKEVLENFTERVVESAYKFPINDVQDGLSYLGIVYGISESLMNVLLEDVRLTRIFFWEAPGIDKEFDLIIDNTYIKVTKYCEDYIKKGQELDIIRKNINTALVAGATIGMVTHLINRFLRGDFGDTPKQSIIECILDLQLNGIVRMQQSDLSILLLKK